MLGLKFGIEGTAEKGIWLSERGISGIEMSGGIWVTFI